MRKNMISTFSTSLALPAAQERHALDEAAKEEYRRERAMVDEVVARINDEMESHNSAKRQKVDETKAFIADYLRRKEERKRREAALEDMEERQREEYRQHVSANHFGIPCCARP